MKLARIFRHLTVPSWWSRRVFGRASLDAIAAAVAATETRHRGELRVAIEGPLHFAALWRGQTARQRAEELFARLRVWDTADNSGILIYVQLVDRQVEILADRGIAARVAAAEWQDICRRMEADFAAGRWLDGMLAAVGRADALLVAHFPAQENNPNELPDRPLML
ncbi:MAG: TPM domain-containing protein [Rhodocyclaceae bacterium]|jgi:hypothetical protein|nr:TPM domain-containing protein [Rhodocyclaceae bacterium]